MITLFILLFIIAVFASLISVKFLKENMLLSAVFFIMPLDFRIFGMLFPQHKLGELNIVPMDFIMPLLILFYFYKLHADGNKINGGVKVLLALIVLLSFVPIYLSKHISHGLIDYYQNIITPIFLFVFCYKFLKEDDINKLFRIMVLSLVLYCVYAFVEHYIIFGNPFELIAFDRQSFTRFESIFAQRNALAIKIIRILPFAFYFAFTKRSLVNYAVCAFLTLTLIVTFSRAGWIALIAMFVLMILFLRKSKIQIVISVLVFIALAVFVLTNEVLAWRLLEPFQQRQVTFTGRTFIWLYGLELLHSNLWTGFSRLDFMMNAGSILLFDINIGSTHNLFLDLLLFIGLPGFTFIAFFLFSSLIFNFKLHRLYRKNYFFTFLLISQLLFILQGLGENTYFGSTRSCIFWILSSIVYTKFLETKNKKDPVFQARAG